MVVTTLLRPRMLVLHTVVAVVVGLLVALGSWQLSRLSEASDRATAVQQRLEQEPVPVAEVLAGVDTGDAEAIASLEFRPALATGVWQPDDEVLQRGRSHRGRAGLGVLTPLLLEDGSTVLVRRGTVPYDNDREPPVDPGALPSGPVTVVGTLERAVPQPSGALAQRDPDDGQLSIVFNTDLDRLGRQLEEPLWPMLLRAAGPTTAADLPLPAPPPTPDRGPHLNYAIQWFSFATIGAGMYALWLRRRVRGDERALSPDAAASASSR